jgi:Tfp pilus assembly major pilin PilA
VKLMSGKARGAGWASMAVIALVAGCSGDIAGELGRNVQVRDRVMSAIAADSALAGEMTARLLGSDLQRRHVIETVLADDRSAQYVLGRIGRNPTAVDYVLQAAASDSAGREHLMTLLKGMQIAMKTAKK